MGAEGCTTHLRLSHDEGEVDIYPPLAGAQKESMCPVPAMH